MPRPHQPGEPRRVNLVLEDDLHLRAKIVALKRRMKLPDLVAEWVKEKVEEAEERGEGAE